MAEYTNELRRLQLLLGTLLLNWRSPTIETKSATGSAHSKKWLIAGRN